jgi:hypothetical protein
VSSHQGWSRNKPKASVKRKLTYPHLFIARAADSLLRSAGLSPKKTGLMILLAFVLVTITRWILRGWSTQQRVDSCSNPSLSISTASSDAVHGSHSHLDPSGLTPRDYLNASLADPAPFDFCPVFGPGDPVAERRGQWGLLKSRLHQGSNARVQRLIQKALSGMPVTISVLGGSGESATQVRRDWSLIRL